MTRILIIVLAVVWWLVPASWAEEPAPTEAAVTTTTRPDRGYMRPSDIPTGLPGFGSPGQKPSADEQKVKVVPKPTTDTP